MPRTTALDLIKQALYETQSLSIGEDLEDAIAEFMLQKLNDILDLWDAQRLYAYNVNFATYPLIPNKQPVTIGPTGADYTVPIRPMKIENANIILNTNTPAVKFPLAIRDDDWWAGQTIPTLATEVPTDLYYSPDWPNGNLFIWPIPQIAYLLELETWVPLLGEASLQSIFSLPPGYKEAVKLTLAESACPSLGKQADPILVQNAMKARAAIQSANCASPTLATSDHGLPKGGGNRSTWNVYTGSTGSAN